MDFDDVLNLATSCILQENVGLGVYLIASNVSAYQSQGCIFPRPARYIK
jgi:hypothetical protein